MSKRKIYVAGPYTKPDPQANTDHAIDVAEDLANHGFVPFIPHLTHYWEARHPRPYTFWLDYDNEWLPCCDGLLRMPGESSGANKEVALAESLGIPVFYSVQELLDWNRDVWSKAA